ncbi:MAG TPA: hypothetical protein VIH29_02800 [Gallionella sp.]
MKRVILSLACVLAVTAITPEAFAIPSFSRQASMTCKACHSQHVPILNGFGQAFKAGGYPMMGTQGKVEGERLSIPDTLNASMLLKARYQKSNGATTDAIPGDTTNSGQWQVPDEFSLYFGGRIAETTGFFFEGNASASQLVAAFKLPAAVYIADAKFSVIPYMTDIQGASYGYELSSTGAARNISWAEHHRETSAQQYIGTDTAATGVAIVAQNDTGYINLSRWAPAFMARKGAAQTLRSTYLRIAATPTVSTTTRGDWALHVGAQFWRGSNYAYDSQPLTGLARLVPVDTRATAFDFQASGQIDGRDLGVYATWAISPAGTAAIPNILNVDSPSRSAEPTLYRLNDRKAWTIGAEYSVVQNTLHIGAAYRSANTGGLTGTAAIVGDNPTDNAVTLTAVYNVTQNMEFHLNHSIYSGTLYNTPQSTGNQLTTFMLEASW